MTIGTYTQRWTLDLDDEFGHQDITGMLEEATASSGVQAGALTAQLVGSTGGLTTIEYETGALRDLRRALDAVAPPNGEYAHNARWGDGNGFAHLRSALIGTSLGIPIVDAQLALGTWQQVVAINFDNRRRRRELVVTIVGE
jgi:secondary thiamine-phosphate synthase enzyme